MGIWPSANPASTTNNGYFVTFNLGAGQRLLAINRADVLGLVAPRALDAFIPQAAGGFYGVLPADVDGWTFPPLNEPGILMAIVPGAPGAVGLPDSP